MAAAAYYVLRDTALGELWIALVKGTAVGCLAGYAFFRFHTRDARWMSLILALGALGDMVIIFWFEAGGAIFFASHIVAIFFFRRFPRAKTTGSQRILALSLLILTPLISGWLASSVLACVYGLGLGSMAAIIWLSRFPRYRVGAGAILFVVSDFLIFAGLGPLEWENLAYWLVWPVYYWGQFLICTGVIQQLRREHRA
ncbi:MAG: lysoplasmalogenase family protein [Sphingomonadaceae bacterium]